MTAPAHTPTPWRFQGVGNITTQLREDGLVESIADVHHLTRPQCSSDQEYFDSMAVANANAAFIVRAVNVYERDQEVIRAAKAYLEVIHGDDSPEAIALRAAIAKAEGRP